MNFKISEEKKDFLIQHLININQLSAGIYQLNEQESEVFYDLAFNENNDLLYMAFIISNCIKKDLYNEGIITGVFRIFLKRNFIRLWEEIIQLCSISSSFLQFVLDSWELDFEEEKYQFLENMKIQSTDF